MIKDYCVKNNLIDEVEEKPTVESFEVEAQRAGDLRLAELKEAHELRELEIKAEREKRELELKAKQEKALLEAEFEAKKEAKKEEHELKMAGLGKHPPSYRDSAFDPARNIRLVPPFQEKVVDKYFAHFEKVADSLNWPKESWVLLLHSVLVGKAQ